MDKYPLVLVGGPPHSGKSVLVSNLTNELRRRGRAHYVLRIAPDGEGDWIAKLPKAQVDELRIKGGYTETYFRLSLETLQNARYPLIVDVGGRPNERDLILWKYCTHAIVLIGHSNSETWPTDCDSCEKHRAKWLGIANDLSMEVVADCTSLLHAVPNITDVGSPLKLTLSGLDRGATIADRAFGTLVDRLESIFIWSDQHLSNKAMADCSLPSDCFFDFQHWLEVQTSGSRMEWIPADLEALSRSLPENAMAIYGRAPLWAYGAAASSGGDSGPIIFDTRLGWVALPEIQSLPEGTFSTTKCQTGWVPTLKKHNDCWVLKLGTESQMLDIQNPDGLIIPEIPNGVRLVISGRLPNWLLMAIARKTMQTARSLAVYWCITRNWIGQL